jgi:hypothetical protein
MSAKTRPCEICLKPIDPGRAEAVPETRLCGEHARQIVQYGGEFRATATTEGTGQKTGRGIVAIRRTRNDEAIGRLRADYEASSRQVEGGHGSPA